MKIQAQIEASLKASLHLEFLEVSNESKNHNVPPGSESHFKIVAVSTVFEGKSLVDRHRELYRLLEGPLKSGVHALALHAFTPSEWEKKQSALASPNCLGGSKH